MLLAHKRDFHKCKFFFSAFQKTKQKLVEERHTCSQLYLDVDKAMQSETEARSEAHNGRLKIQELSEAVAKHQAACHELYDKDERQHEEKEDYLQLRLFRFVLFLSRLDVLFVLIWLIEL